MVRKHHLAQLLLMVVAVVVEVHQITMEEAVVLAVVMRTVELAEALMQLPHKTGLAIRTLVKPLLADMAAVAELVVLVAQSLQAEVESACLFGVLL
jgi:hypothetical protein